MVPVAVQIDVTGRIPLDGSHHISAWVFPPKRPARSVPFLLCMPGGTYSKAYWHLEVPGYEGYSFAQHMADQGMLVVAIDHLGTGESSRHPKAAELTPEAVSKANAVASEELVAMAQRGTLLPDAGPLEINRLIGVGHSMGGMLAIFQQSLYDSFDGIAVLGYGTIGPIIDFSAQAAEFETPTYESIMAAARNGDMDEPLLADRAMPALRHHFYKKDVPSAVIAADDLTNTYLPGVTGLLCIVPYVASDHAGRVSCPVFIGLGERDSTPCHHDEPRAYRSSNDVTLFILRHSAHCHNSASSRHVLWDRIGNWVRGSDC